MSLHFALAYFVLGYAVGYVTRDLNIGYAIIDCIVYWVAGSKIYNICKMVFIAYVIPQCGIID